MTDYISREVLERELNAQYAIKAITSETVRDILNHLPSVQPTRPHGEWGKSDIPESILSKCSVCGFNLGAYTHNFCPNCGADMRGDNNADSN